jgi:hypothetical protein
LATKSGRKDQKWLRLLRFNRRKGGVEPARIPYFDRLQLDFQRPRCGRNVTQLFDLGWDRRVVEDTLAQEADG